MIAHTFVITTLDDGRVVGLALIAPQARYCSVLSPRDRRIDRRFVEPRQWLAIEHQLEGHESGPISDDSPIARTLRAGKNVAVQFLHAMPVDASVEGTAVALDSRLRGIAAPVS